MLRAPGHEESQDTFGRRSLQTHWSLRVSVPLEAQLQGRELTLLDLSQSFELDHPSCRRCREHCRCRSRVFPLGSRYRAERRLVHLSRAGHPHRRLFVSGPRRSCHVALAHGTFLCSPLGRGFLTGSLKSRADIPEGDSRLMFDRFSVRAHLSSHAAPQPSY